MDDQQFTRVGKALADPRRVEIYEVIAAVTEMSCGAIADRFPIGQSTVSHHLKILADAGLMAVRREGQHSFFAAEPAALEAYVTRLRQRLIPGSSRRAARKK